MSVVRLRAFIREARELFREFYMAPYRQTIARARRDEEDFFMLLLFSEAMGVPNPASYYTLELLPVVMTGFHSWHTRMGLENSPLGSIRCC